jgi:hypothetical protein
VVEIAEEILARRFAMVFFERIILSAALMALLMVPVQISSGQPMLEDKDMGHRGNFDLRLPDGTAMVPKMCDPSKEMPIELLIRGRGFALKDDETHTLRTNVERLMPLEPMAMRRLISSNKSIEEIRENILTKRGNAIYRGNMRLDWRNYILMNIEVSPSDGNNTIVRGDVVDPSLEVIGNNPVTIGQIAIDIAQSDGGMIGKGNLRINSGQHTGSYNILLEMIPPIGEKHMMSR